jgi:hypothetical protein
MRWSQTRGKEKSAFITWSKGIWSLELRGGLMSARWPLVAFLYCSGAYASFVPSRLGSMVVDSGRRVSRSCSPRSQLVHAPKPGGDNDDGEEEEDVILSVSRVVDENGQPLVDTGRSVASMQFMITRAMRAELAELGYSKAEVDGMEPARAGAILAQRTPSSKQAQVKPKTKRSRFELQFTCNVCEAPNSHSISHHAYTRGTVVVTCPGCQSTHLIADHLNWIEDDFKNLESYMAQRGTPVTRVVNDGVAASAAASAASSAEGASEGGNGADGETAASGDESTDRTTTDPRRPWRGTREPIEPLGGITPEQARRIREAVRERKRQRRQSGDDFAV